MIRSFLTLAFCFIVNAYASAQLFQVPARVTFGNVVVNMNTGAQDLVQTDVNALLSNRNTLNSRLDRAVLYFPVVENILAEENVPGDFKYLVLQESGLAPDAVSTSNAVGFWQFKKETAQEFGLRVDDEIDERKNIHSSTRAAARYLKKNNAVTQNWVSTLYSYYLGLGGIRSLVPTEWSTAKEISVTEKTDRYILRCLAHKIVYENELKGYRTGQTPFYEYKASGGKTFTQVADQLGVDEVELRRYNRWVGGSKIPQDKEYVMLVVVSNSNSPVIASAANGRPTVVQPTTPKPGPVRPKDPEFPVLKRITPTGKNQSNGPIFYEINGKKGILAQEGDTYQTIADRADIKYSRFLSRNDMSESDAVVAGKVYYLQKKARKGNVPTHTLQHGENIWDVAQMYGIRLPFLLRLNRIASASEPLQPGRVLHLQKRISCDVAPEVVPLPDPEPEKPAEEKPVTDVVTTQPANTTAPATTPGDVKVTPSNAAPQKSSGRVVLVDENGKVVSGNPATQPATQPSRPADNQAVNRPAVTPPPTRTEPSPAVTYPARPAATEKPRAAPIEEPAPSEDNNAFHTVQGGETFYSIARKYQMTPGELRRLNGFQEYPNVRIGQRLRVIGGVTPDEAPMTAKVAPAAAKVTAPVETAPVSSSNSQYTVGPGDTFYSIARKHGITPEELRDLNGLTDFPRVKVGDKLTVKAGGKATESSRLPSNRATGGVTTHIIQSGETLHSISRKYDVKVKDIMEWNNISSANAIQAGQKLKIRKP